MFRVRSTETGRFDRLVLAGLLTLSVLALAMTYWVMVDVLGEQEIVRELIQRVPPDAAISAKKLAGELKWQLRLTILVILNLVVTGFAIVLLWRAYRVSRESLRDIKALAADILNSMDQAVLTTDRAGHVTSINRRGIELLALTEESVGRPLQELSDGIPLEEFRQESRSGDLVPLVRDFPTFANQTLRVFCQPLRNYADVEIGNIVQIRDVSERALMHERLRRMERYMGLGSLAAGLHHEIKNPLAALSLHVQLLEEELDGPSTQDEVHRMLNVIKMEVARIGRVLESFRDFASSDQLSRSPVDLAKLVTRQAALIEPQANRQHIRVQVGSPTEPLPPISADRVRLEQVVLNLMVNAMEAMPNGGTLSVRAALADDRTSARIEVVDTGNGVPDSLHDRIFDPYFTTKCEGTGMGLALSEKIIRQHDGSIEFHRVGGKTVFEVTLPIEQFIDE